MCILQYLDRADVLGVLLEKIVASVGYRRGIYERDTEPSVR